MDRVAFSVIRVLSLVWVAYFGLPITYCIDFLSFWVSLLSLSMIRDLDMAVIEERISPLKGVREGLKYAISRPELIGSYGVDFVAMVFGMPTALFPAISESFGGAKVVGLLYAAPSFRAFKTR